MSDADEVEALLREASRAAGGGAMPVDLADVLPDAEEYRRSEEVSADWDGEWGRLLEFLGDRGDRPARLHFSSDEDWSIEHQAAGWDGASATDGGRKRRRVRVGFITAYSPPRDWVIAASRRFPDFAFRLRWWVDNLWVTGLFVARAGVVLADAEVED